MKRDVLLVAFVLLSGIAIGLAIGLNIEPKWRTRTSVQLPAPDVAQVDPAPSPHVSHKSEHPKNWRQLEKGVGSLSRKSSKWFLFQTRIPDFGQELKDSRPMATADPELNGCFSGEIRLVDGRIWKVDVEIGITQVGGNVSVQLSENGRVFNHLSANGELKDLRSFVKPSAAFILEASEDRFLQVYRNHDLWCANYYERVELMNFAFKGTAILDRGACHG